MDWIIKNNGLSTKYICLLLESYLYNSLKTEHKYFVLLKVMDIVNGVNLGYVAIKYSINYWFAAWI